MTSGAIKAQYDADDSKIFCLDATYACPSKEWVSGSFRDYFCGVLDHLKVKGWTAQFDCDKFSRLAQIFAGLCHSEAHQRSEQGLAFGVFNYTRKDRQGHSINTVVTEKGVIFWEPQTQKLVTLTDKEKCSATLILF